MCKSNCRECGYQAAAQRGKALSDMLGLKKHKDCTYHTAWGRKTDAGLHLTVANFLSEQQEEDRHAA